ncbi:MAG: chromosome condensation regulator [Hyperionvirus sp.]|uniref:Chromosome condensation regulator n=1 Tax=Hyperionvirus sp. TaxID=2487770 RepID=A0A3G5A5U3_9VIRU|nr:MAG: chromosome condensation regulator [Hyperionvirus sp.]
MDDLIFLQSLPLDLLYIVTNYDPAVLFIYPKKELIEFNWTRLLKFNFHKDYKDSSISSDQLMRIYIHNYWGINKIICGREEAFIINDNATVMNFDMGQRVFFEKMSFLSESRPCDIKDFEKNILQIAYGGAHIIVLLIDGTLLCRGSNYSGQLGLGHLRARDKFHKNDTLEGMGKDMSIRQIACGNNHTLILLTNGTLWGCGDNRNGQLGFESLEDIKSLTKIDDVKNIVQIACGFYHSFIKLDDGTIMGCGNNSSGQLGLGEVQVVRSFTKIEYVSKNISEIVCGNCTTFLLMDDGTSMSCGFGLSGTLGHGDNLNRDTFSPIKNLSNIVKMQAGYDHVICSLSNGTIMSCGSFYSNEFHPSNQNIFTEIKNLPGKVENIGTGPFAEYVIIRLTDGTLIRYGDFTFKN